MNIYSALGNKRIFIVEDNRLNRVVYDLILKRFTAMIDFDVWGKHTLSFLDKTSYDLIILDLMLPHGDSGYDIFKNIRNLPEYGDVPIIAVSASDSSTAIPKAKELGFNGFIAKPINKSLFPKQLASIFSGEAVWYSGTH